MKRIAVGTVLVCVLAISLFAPDVMRPIFDRQLATAQWEVGNNTPPFAYQGTPENRIRALDAWQNHSRNIRYSVSDSETSLGTDVWNALHQAGLLPIAAEDASCVVQPFPLFPRGLSAEYRFVDIVCESAGNRLHVILDAETRAYLRIDYTGAPDTLTDWMTNSGTGFSTAYKWDELMKSYAALLDFGALRDLGGVYTDGAMIQGCESDISGTLFAVSLRYSTQTDLLSYKVFARAFQ